MKLSVLEVDASKGQEAPYVKEVHPGTWTPNTE